MRSVWAKLKYKLLLIIADYRTKKYTLTIFVFKNTLILNNWKLPFIPYLNKKLFGIVLFI